MQRTIYVADSKLWQDCVAEANSNGLNPWNINTERPGVAFEVVVEREK